MATKNRFSLESLLESCYVALNTKINGYIVYSSEEKKLYSEKMGAFERASVAMSLVVKNHASPDFSLNVARTFLKSARDLIESVDLRRESAISLESTDHSVRINPSEQIHKFESIRKIILEFESRFDEFEKSYERIDFLDRQLSILGADLDAKNKVVQSLDEKLDSITNFLEASYNPLKSKIEEIDESFNSGIKYIDDRKKEVNDVTSLVTGKAVVTKYSERSDIEELAANRCRLGAVIFMMVSCTVAAFAIYHAQDNFKIEVSIFKIILALLLSVPAAYLARESAKHRKQQYEFLQIALDIHAINPYVATLPEKVQSKLKKDMAKRIFVSKNFDHIIQETYPINLQESLAKIVEILGEKTKKKKEKEKSEDDGKQAGVKK